MAAARSVCIKTKWADIQTSSTLWKNIPTRSTKVIKFQSSLLFFSCRDLYTQHFEMFRESMFLVFVLEFDLWSETVHQHVIKNSDSKSSKFNHLSFWMANNYSSASQLSTTISATKHACTGPRNYRSGHLCCDELYSSPDELLLVKWTSVLVLKIWTTRSRRRRWEPYVS